MISARIPSAYGKRNPNPGFTLVELLIVIGIVAVLALISILAARKFMNKAMETKSLNTIRQVATANMAYAQENNGEINVVRVDSETQVERRPGRGYVADSFWGRITPYLFSDIAYSSANQPKLAADIKQRLLTFHGTTNINTMAKTFQRDVPIYGGDGSGIKVPYTFSTYLAPWNRIVKTSTVADPAQTAYMTFGSYRFNENDMSEYSPHVSPRIPQKRVDFFSNRKAAIIFLDGHLEMVGTPMPKRRFGQ
ncbi:prepilin-type N-terminal cleavage/methylation domain-containing protein [Akkermansiaceae bacterium]|nr:prepilin-type N-terminal cleavage/methylation domain-containing protein [Akkermansiaceae bacterium]